MKTSLTVEDHMGDKIQMDITDDDSNVRNWVNITLKDVSVDVYVPDLQRALETFRYPTPDELENNRKEL